MNNLLKQYEPDLIKGNVKIYLLGFNTLNDPLLQEIGKLRTETFGEIGAGTNKQIDVDDYDLKAIHIIISDNEDIIGSYRVAKMKSLIVGDSLESHISKYYNLSDKFYKKQDRLMELGRSFIQKKYWAGNYLDYLWYGIGEFVRRNQEINLLYGSISIGNNYSEKAKTYIKVFVDKWYAEYDNEITPIYPYQFNEEDYKFMSNKMDGKDPVLDIKLLKETLLELGFIVPPLLKKYLSITEIGGAKIKSSAFEPTFNASSFLLVLDIRKLKPLHKERYFPFL